MARAKRRIAIACQGGGSQTAFTAGAFKGLFDAGLSEHFDVVSLSGASGGAVCATLVWYALRHQETDVTRRLLDFWADNTAQSPAEEQFNRYLVESTRAMHRGRIPQLGLSPYSPFLRFAEMFADPLMRRQFSDFRSLLERHIDFAELERAGADPARPLLLLGAANVLSGRLEKFCSRHGPIKAEHLLASSAVPEIFQAVEIGGVAYWDGLFSDNPPIDELVNPDFVGEDNLPQELWVIKINPTASQRVPRAPEEIADRRNEMVGNLSLFHQLDAVCHLNELMLAGAFRARFLGHLGMREPILVPRPFDDKPPRPYAIPFLEMSAELLGSLDFESKLDRSRDNIQRLIKDGERRGRAFLEGRLEALGVGKKKPPA